MRQWNTAVLRAIAVLLALVTFMGACGIPRDDAPRELAFDDIVEGLRPGQLPTPTPGFDAITVANLQQIFMIGPNDRMYPVDRERVETPERALEVLLLGTRTEEREDGVTTALTRETQINSIAIEFKLAIVELAPGSLNPNAGEQKLAFSQVVYTLTALPQIDLVQFVQTNPSGGDPIPIAVQTDSGSTLAGGRVDRSSYSLLEPLEVRIGFEPEFPTPTPEAFDVDTPIAELPVWLINESGQLEKVVRAAPRSARGLLTALFGGPRLNEREQFESAVPPDALPNVIEIVSLDIVVTDQEGNDRVDTAGIAFVDLAQGSLPSPADGDQQLLAVAQIVFTLTELAEVDQVVISIDGAPRSLPTEQGFADIYDEADPRGLTRLDYATLAPGIAIPLPRGVSPTPGPTPEPSAGPSPTATPEGALEPTPEPTPEP